MDPKNILDLLRRASPLDVFLVSFFLLPFVFDAWLTVLDKLGVSNTTRGSSLAVILFAYIAGMVMMLISSSRRTKAERARDEICNYLKRHDFEKMRFVSVRKYVDKSYSDDFLRELVPTFPDTFRKAKLDGDEGIAIFVVREKTSEGNSSDDAE